VRTGEVEPAWVFVAGLGCSQLLFAWAADDRKSRNWLDSEFLDALLQAEADYLSERAAQRRLGDP